MLKGRRITNMFEIGDLRNFLQFKVFVNHTIFPSNLKSNKLGLAKNRFVQLLYTEQVQALAV